MQWGTFLVTNFNFWRRMVNFDSRMSKSTQIFLLVTRLQNPIGVLVKRLGYVYCKMIIFWIYFHKCHLSSTRVQQILIGIPNLEKHSSSFFLFGWVAVLISSMNVQSSDRKIVGVMLKRSFICQLLLRKNLPLNKCLVNYFEVFLYTPTI